MNRRMPPSRLRAASRSSGTWKDNDFDVLEDGVVVGLIFFLDAVGPQDRPLDVGEQSQRRHTPRRARLRADARGRDGGVREESVQGVKGVGRPSDASIQNISGVAQGPAVRSVIPLMAANQPYSHGLVGTERGEHAHVRHETTRVRHASRRRGGCMAARGAGAAAGDAHDRSSRLPIRPWRTDCADFARA